MKADIESPAGARKRSRVRVALVTVALCLVVAELSFTAALWLETGQLIWLHPIVSQPKTGSVLPNLMMLDPYLGYSHQPGHTREPGWAGWRTIGYSSQPDWVSWPVNNYGFNENRDYPVSAVPGRDFIVGVFGSSVAAGLALHGRPELIKYLQANPALQGRNIIVLTFCGGGYKQPQQLLALSYFVALGQHFDLIINMDGSAGAYIGWENVMRYHVDPLMPTARFVYGLQNLLVDASASEAKEAARLRVAKLNGLLDDARSGAWYSLLRFVRNRMEDRRAETLTEDARIVSGRKYVVRMNKATQQDFSQQIGHIAEVWARSSLEMEAIANHIGATYLHILEPNQWLGRKPLSAEEQRVLAQPDVPMAAIAPPMYDALLAQSAQLREKVNFIDGTHAFEGHEETLYLDACCHFNLRGYNLLVDNVMGPWLQSFRPAGDKPVEAH